MHDLGLVVIWDDGDDLHAEPRSPYVHVRDVLVLRAHLAGAAALLGGHARTAEGQLLVETGWARSLEAAAPPCARGATGRRGLGRRPGPRPAGAGGPPPAQAFEAAREALAAGAPVLVQVPRRGYVPGLACARDRTPARCAVCAGPLSRGRASAPACRWCGRPAADWQLPGLRRPRAAGHRGRCPPHGGGARPRLPGVPVRTSGRDEVLATVAGTPALVVATPGAEPVAEGGYGAVLLLDAWSLLGRADLRAGEEALRRWLAAAALARPGARGWSW